VAIVGPSGCGKSTIVGLFQKIWEPSEGGIYTPSFVFPNNEKDSIGIPLSEIEAKHLRNKVSLVSQSPQLFNESVASNIRYGSPIISDEAVRNAAKAANVHEVIMGLRGGYGCVIGGGGDTGSDGENKGSGSGCLSGGEMQRVQIARALARVQAAGGAEVLILDECTSALDAENEGKVMDAIRGIVHGAGSVTVIIVTHKISVMQLCDRIIVLGDGSVQEEGSFEGLMSRRGVFASLVSGGEFMG